MPRYIIEREIPGAGQLSSEELHAISQKSCGVLSELGPQVQWVRSHVTADKMYCEYIAPDEASIHELARRHAGQRGQPGGGDHRSGHGRVSQLRRVPSR